MPSRRRIGALSGLGSVPLPEDAELDPGLERSPLGAGVFLGILLFAQVTILGDSTVGCVGHRSSPSSPSTTDQGMEGVSRFTATKGSWVGPAAGRPYRTTHVWGQRG